MRFTYRADHINRRDYIIIDNDRYARDWDVIKEWDSKKLSRFFKWAARLYDDSEIGLLSDETLKEWGFEKIVDP